MEAKKTYIKQINKDEILNLAQIQAAHCVSLYLSTHISGKEVNEDIDAKHLKNMRKEVAHVLFLYGLNNPEIDAFLKAIDNLIDDNDFWREQQNGLAIFLSDKEFLLYKSPLAFREKIYISDHYYTLPLSNLLDRIENFYLLCYSLKNSKLYKGNDNSLELISTDEEFPKDLESAVGSDFEQSSLQARAGQQGAFHGHGQGKEDKKEEVTKHAKAMANYIGTKLKGSSDILLVQSTDSNFYIYKEHNKYGNLHNDNIDGSPDRITERDLHKASMKVLAALNPGKKWFDLKAFEEAIALGKGSERLDDILDSLIEGKVNRLYIKEGLDTYGIYNATNGKLELHQGKNSHNTSLQNLAAYLTLKQAGIVRLVPKEEGKNIPDFGAIYRY